MLDRSLLEDLHSIRGIRDLVRTWWKIEIGFAYADGYVADHARGVVIPPHNAFCRASLAHPEGFQRCNRSVYDATMALAQESPVRVKAVRMETCHLGFPFLMVPIVRQGTILGNLFTGGFLLEDELSERSSRIASESQLLALDVGSIVDAVDAIPVLSPDDAERLSRLMEYMASEIAVAPGVSQALARKAQVRGTSGEKKRLQFVDIIGVSPVMQELYELIDKLAPTESTVLITGEDGTGKELVARAIHARSQRNDTDYVIRNCSAFNENLLESELFGHIKGSFTGADRDRMGVFEAADGGTLFLDEVGDTSPAMQVKLLRVLQDGTFVPVGASKARSTDVRLVAATNRPLKEMIVRGEFRKDLYYRLNVINVHLPPLRERPEDLPYLCDHFLSRLAERMAGPQKVILPEVMSAFYAYNWPGNIRELQSEVERLYVLTGELTSIDSSYLSPHILEASTSRLDGRSPGDIWGRLPDRNAVLPLSETVAQVEREVISQGLIRTNWNKSRLAKELQISRTTLIRKIKELNLEEKSLDG